ncbi:MAG: hypothetical protein J3R72DRAFT_494060 [Linnemannia gamsii]|nr:MAG: hypothetical protein J3R72DRAFT_494060 [Linnemannia gamsii]
MAYVTIDENILLIQGGVDPSNKTAASTTATSKQFFSLDFTKSASWNTTSPPWTQLNVDGDLGPASFGHSLSVSPDRRTITAWDSTNIAGQGIMAYSLDNHQWTKVVNGPMELSTQAGLQAVAHPTNGLVYIPSGINNSDSDMMIYDLLKSTVKQVPMPPRESNNLFKWYGYSFVWSEVRQSFLILGGGGNVGPYFYEYSVSNNRWNELPLEGDAVPPRVKNACLVPAYNGTKILLFGGLTSTGAAVGTLYTLDVTNMIWSLSESTQPSQNRYGMACSVSGDNFVIWGGQTAGGAALLGPPLIYNINTDKWATQFVRGTHYTGTGSSGYDPPPMTSPADVGGAITAGVVVVSVVGFIFYRRRKNRRQKASLHGQSHQFYRMQESDMSLNSIVSPPPITGASAQGGSHGTEQADKSEVLLASSAQASRNRLYGSHSNAQPISLSYNNGYSSVPISNDNSAIDFDSRPSPTPPAFSSPPSSHTPWHDPNSHSLLSDSSAWSTPPTNPSWPTPPTNPSWSTPPTNPSWSTPPVNPAWSAPLTPAYPPVPADASSSSSASPASSWATPLSQTNHPSAPPPPYPVSPSSSHAVIFRKEAVTDLPTPFPPINPAFKNISNSDGHCGIDGGYDRKVEELQHQLAARKEELSRRSIGLHPQFYPGATSDAQIAPKAVIRNPQGAGDIVMTGSSSSGNGSSGQSNEELQQQVLALQAELSRLQAMIGSQ